MAQYGEAWRNRVKLKPAEHTVSQRKLNNKAMLIITDRMEETFKDLAIGGAIVLFANNKNYTIWYGHEYCSHLE